MAGRYHSWGNYPKSDQSGRDCPSPEALPASLSTASVLPFGNGRSYGDVCLNPEGEVLDTRRWNRFLHFDEQTGVLRCESGVLFDDILQTFVPRGWFLPVTPGTRFVTVGGAVANDVHGKNHHTAGTFGHVIRRFELLRTDGRIFCCSPEENPEYFAATIGGLGLTGFITWVEMQLRPIQGNAMEEERIPFSCMEDFFTLSSESDRFEYTVAQVDCLAMGERLGRGIFVRANHSAASVTVPGREFSVPLVPPFSLVNRLSLRAFNTWYYRRQKHAVSRCVHYQPYFYPLDAVGNWNRLYGPRGFLQYQCVLPEKEARASLRAVLERVARSGEGSVLAVLKMFGHKVSPGWLSFPMPGVTLAVDFPYRGERTFRLFAELDSMVREAGGRLYPAKDACMRAEDFQAFYPNWQRLEALRDPRITSGFWQRVTGKGG